MTEKLTEDDINRLDSFNLFRFDNTFYGGSFIAGLVFLILVPFIPYTGWRKRPETPPRDLNEYFTRLLPYLIITLILVLLPIINWIIKKIELREGTKKIVLGQVTYKARLLKRRKLIIFKPFKIVVFKSGFHLEQLEVGDKVKMELTSLGRLLNQEKINYG